MSKDMFLCKNMGNMDIVDLLITSVPCSRRMRVIHLNISGKTNVTLHSIKRQKNSNIKSISIPQEQNQKGILINDFS